MHIQQLLNMLVNGHRNDMKVAVARFDQGTSYIPGFVWAIPTPQKKPDAISPFDVFFALTNFLDDERAGHGFYSIVDIKFQGQRIEVTQSELEGSDALVLCQFMPWQVLPDAVVVH